METNITLYGASGHGKVIIDILNACSISVKNVVDDNPKTESILEKPILKVSEFDFGSIEQMIISIGNNKVRKSISDKLKVSYANAIHPSAILSNYIQIGIGTVVMAGAIINANAVIGNHCIINSGAIVEHDCTIEDFVHVSPGVSLAGNVNVKEGAHVGIGASIIQGVTIGKWAIIGAGSVVLKDVPDYATVVGNPSRVIKILNP